MPKLSWILTGEDGADNVDVGEQVVLVNFDLLGHHLIDEIGGYRLPVFRRCTHRSRDVELAQNKWKMKWDYDLNRLKIENNQDFTFGKIRG